MVAMRPNITPKAHHVPPQRNTSRKKFLLMAHGGKVMYAAQVMFAPDGASDVALRAVMLAAQWHFAALPRCHPDRGNEVTEWRDL